MQSIKSNPYSHYHEVPLICLHPQFMVLYKYVFTNYMTSIQITESSVYESSQSTFKQDEKTCSLFQHCTINQLVSSFCAKLKTAASFAYIMASLIYLRAECSAALGMTVKLCDDDRCNVNLLLESTSLHQVINIKQCCSAVLVRDVSSVYKYWGCQ